MVQNELFIEFWSKIPHFYPLGGVIGASATTWSHAGAAAVRGDPPASLSTHWCLTVGAIGPSGGAVGDPTPGPRKGNLNENPARRAFGNKI